MSYVVMEIILCTDVDNTVLFLIIYCYLTGNSVLCPLERLKLLETHDTLYYV